VLMDNPSANQLFAVHGCPLNKWLEIERCLDRLSLRVHQFYDSIEQVRIVKLKPSPCHGVIVGTFNSILPAVLALAGNTLDIAHMADTRFVNPNGSRKEPDASWRPKGHRSNRWPRLALEVGFSEGLNQLRRDAKWWLESSPTVVLPNGIPKRTVQQIVIINPSQNQMTLTIESWVLGQDPGITRNQGNRGGIVEREQSATTLTTVDFLLPRISWPPT
jgi:hypothetical protein